MLCESVLSILLGVFAYTFCNCAFSRISFNEREQFVLCSSYLSPDYVKDQQNA